ncbi:DUF1353 domain-containing protein [Cognatishimia sp. F0-27]|uniref:DUF1353 domain-containing protein n=1 Tax=Cognatishimia sp. F0-27 TaxID=2816855 RepID=UPI001D0C6654|nr:DUF1353 domain-containing protein [Cognatishimia sp. F0-27]MCC1492191.1 DUF1353 domain-containing protein [Cognatishimia sp. F0-27]
MIRFAMLGLGALLVAGCVPAALSQLEAVDTEIVTCATHPDGGCTFDQSPLRVLPEPVTIPKRPYQFFPTAEPLTFIDPNGRQWIAPRRTLTDGASIPPIFVSIVGDPTDPSFINAAAVHDAYCGIGNETGARYHDGTWQDVHKMFFDGLITGGTEEVTAKLMFAAVWLGGPRWQTTRGLNHVPAPRMQKAMRQTKSFVESSNPPFGALLRYLGAQERQILSEYPAPGLARDDDAMSSSSEGSFDEGEYFGEGYFGGFGSFGSGGFGSGDF